MKKCATTIIAIITMLGFMAPAGAQDGQAIRNDSDVLAVLEDVPAGSLCEIFDINNVSTYPPNDHLSDRGNLLLVETGRGGEHDGDWQSFPAERVEGTETFPMFVSGGDGFGGPARVVVYVLFDVHSSIDDITIQCTPELPPTTPVCVIADALDAGWTPDGDIPCAHTNDTPTTTTIVDTPTTTVVDTPTTTSTPMLAITGPGSTGLFAGLGAMFLLAGVVGVRMAKHDD